MTTEQFTRESCELIEVIQELEINTFLIKEKLEQLRNNYKKQLEEEAAAANDTVIYCGDEDRVEFFEEIISALGLDINYEVRVVDGEYEIMIGENER